MRGLLTGLLLFLAMTAPLWAQLAPEIGYALPAGAQAGTTVDLTLGGYDWTPDMQLFVHDPRIKLELIGPPTEVLITEPPYWFGAKARGYAWPLPREFRARLTVPADVPPGLVKWQVANANGVSPTGVLHITTLPEILEQPVTDGPQLLPSLPVVVSGQIRRIEEVDRYRLQPQQSGLVTVQLLARSLTAPTNPMALHGMLQVTDDTGRRIVDVSGTEGLDLQSTFAVEANREYVLSLHDVDFAGDRSYVYRLVITPGPRLVATIPAAEKRGETRPVEFIGYGIATGTAMLESVMKEITFPSDPAMKSWRYVLETPFGRTAPYEFLLSDIEEVTEGAALEALPLAVTGTLDVRFGTDSYPVQLKKGDLWHVSATSQSEGLPLDLALRLTNAAGKEVVAADDVSGSTNPECTYAVPEDGIYTVHVTDRSGHSGNRGAVYRLCIIKPQADVTFTVPDSLAVSLGATANLSVKVVRSGDFKGPIGLTLAGLPAGLSVPENLTIAEGKNELTVEVTSAANAAVTAGLVTIQATMTLAGTSVTRPVKTLVMASTMKPRIKITPEGLDDVKKVRRGSTHRFPLQIDRLEGYTGPLTLEMTAKQQRHRQGLASDELVVAPEQSRVDYPIFVPEWMETTKTSRMILNGRVTMPDPQGNVRTLLQKMELRLGILPEGALMKLAHAPGEYQVPLSGELMIPLTIARVAEFREPLTLEFVPTERQAGRITTEPRTLTPTDTQVSLKLRIAEDVSLRGEQTLLFRATAMQPGLGLVKSETTVMVDVR